MNRSVFLVRYITLTPTSEEEGRSNHILFGKLRRFVAKLSGIRSLLQYNSCLRNSLKTNAALFSPITTDDTFVLINLLLIWRNINIQKIYLCTATQRLFKNALKTNLFCAITTYDIFVLTNLLIFVDVLLE